MFNEQYDEIVLVRDMTFHSMCEHHLLPFTGVATYRLLAQWAVVGLSKLARLVDEGSETSPSSRTDDTDHCRFDGRTFRSTWSCGSFGSQHSCMTIRGIKKPGSLCLTSAMRGAFRDDPKSRAEVLELITRSKG